MEIVTFTIVAIALYIIADRALDRIEVARGARFENRGLIFFAILLSLALVSFTVIEWLMAPGQIDSGQGP